MVGAYLDESADEKAETVFTLAAYTALTQTWVREFEPKWEQQLNNYNLKYFRASECQSGIGEFAQFRANPSDDQARLTKEEQAKLTKIKTAFVDVALAQRPHMWGWGVNVFVEDLKAVLKDNPAAEPMLGKEPYIIGYQILISAIGLTVKTFNEAQKPRYQRHMIGFVFDDHCKELKARALAQYDRFQEVNPASSTWMARLTFADDKKVCELQAADNLAFEVRKNCFNRLKHPEIDERRALKRLKGSIATVYNLDRKSLEAVIKTNLDIGSISSHEIHEI